MNQELIGAGYHILAKPSGPLCNLDCKYCFYLEKKNFLEEKNQYRMSDEVLEAFICKYISSQDIPEIQFVWQGGEPTLTGLDFYRKVIVLQKKHANGKKIINSLQTNGILLNEEWGAFLKEHNFLVGISMDGPREIHDRYRVDKGGRPTFDHVVSAVRLMQKFQIPYNVLVCVTNEASEKPLEIYYFLKKLGVKYIQFTPVIERQPCEEDSQIGLKHGSPHSAGINLKLTDFSVKSGNYGSFLIQIFDKWVRKDVGKIFIMNFEWALESWLGLPSTVCIFSEKCGKALAIEHNGDIYSCDHYVYPQNMLGNILNDNPKALLELRKQVDFGKNKQDGLPGQCRSCEVRFACNGECPRHRFTKTSNGEPGLSYLCEDYKKFFYHIHPYMKAMIQFIENDMPPSKVMEAIKGPVVIC